VTIESLAHLWTQEQTRYRLKHEKNRKYRIHPMNNIFKFIKRNRFVTVELLKIIKHQIYSQTSLLHLKDLRENEAPLSTCVQQWKFRKSTIPILVTILKFRLDNGKSSD
jgi:hypothetical protein